MKLVSCYVEEKESDYLKCAEKINCYAVPFSNDALKERLLSKCKVTTFPSVTIFSPIGDLLNINAYEDIRNDPYGFLFPWPQGTIYDFIEGPVSLKHEMIPSINEIICNKVFGVYYSASWCEKEYFFLETLIKIHKNVVIENNIDFPIIYFCFDSFLPEFNYTCDNILFFVIPFGDRRYKSILLSLNITDIPIFSLYDQYGEMIYKNAIPTMLTSPYNYPWYIYIYIYYNIIIGNLH